MKKSSNHTRPRILRWMLAAAFLMISFQNFSNKTPAAIDPELQFDSANRKTTLCALEGCPTGNALTDENGEIIGYVGAKFQKVVRQGKEPDLSHTAGSILNAIDPDVGREILQSDLLKQQSRKTSATEMPSEPDGFKAKTEIAIDN